MTEGSPIRLLISFALPLMVGNVFQQLYTVVDTAVVGQFVGVSALASLGAADSPNWGVLGIIQGLTQGFSILMAQHFGAKDYRELSRSVGASVTLCLVFTVLLGVGGQLWAETLLRLLNTPQDVLPGALLYLRIVYGGIPAIMAYNFLAAILRALGDAKTPLYAIVVAALMNVVLDLLFVVGFHWGIAGAAIATVVSQVASAVYCFFNVRKITILQVLPGDLKPSRDLTLTLLKLGFPMALQNAIIAMGSMVVQFVINGYGMLFLAGFTATNKLYGLLEIAATSYGFAVTSYVGQNLGARLVNRIKRGQRAAAVVAFLTSAGAGAVHLRGAGGGGGLFGYRLPLPVHYERVPAHPIYAAHLPLRPDGPGGHGGAHALRLRGDGGAHWRGVAAAFGHGPGGHLLRGGGRLDRRGHSAGGGLLRQDAGPLPAQGLCPGRKKLKGVLVWSRR